jgi:lysozyme
MYEDGTKVQPGDKVTKDRAEVLMRLDAQRKWNAIKHAILVPLNDNQMAAIISLVYNIGVGGFLRSTLLRRINSGASKEQIEAAFMMWNKGRINGKLVEIPGLTNRRKKEAKLFFS